MEKLRIYRIRDGFIEFLHEKDHRVQFNKRETDSVDGDRKRK
jgi:hypothetical protein